MKDCGVKMRSHNSLIPRDAEPNSDLGPGAVAGIACGAGALFLAAAGLFIIYYRRKRQLDREDGFYQNGTEENAQAGASVGPAVSVSYTMDYKISHRHREDTGSSYTYSPEKPTYGFSPLNPNETTIAMPTHPAYIPRALVRGDPAPSTRIYTSSSASASSTPQFMTHTKAPPPPIQIPRPDGSLAAPTAGHLPIHSSSDSTSLPLDFYHNSSSDSSLGGLPLTKPNPNRRHLAPQVPAIVIPSSSHNTVVGSGPGLSSVRRAEGDKKPRQYLPPRLNLSGTGSKPLQGKENTTISGPLAFPELYQPPPQAQPEPQPQAQSRSQPRGWRQRQLYSDDDDDEDEECEQDVYDEDEYPHYQQRQPQHTQPSGDNRTFRDRSLSSGHGHGRTWSNSSRQQYHHQSGNRHYAEVEIGRDSDIW